MNAGSASQKLPEKLQRWVAARDRFKLSHAQVQMARELGLNPRKLTDKLRRHQTDEELPVPELIERVYRERFGRETPERVDSIEARAAEAAGRKSEARSRRQTGKKATRAGDGD